MEMYEPPINHFKSSSVFKHSLDGIFNLYHNHTNYTAQADAYIGSRFANFSVSIMLSKGKLPDVLCTI